MIAEFVLAAASELKQVQTFRGVGFLEGIFKGSLKGSIRGVLGFRGLGGLGFRSWGGGGVVGAGVFG